MYKDTERSTGDKLMKYIVIIAIAVAALTVGGLFGFPSYSRYQDRQNAANEVTVSSIEIRNQEQHVEIEKRKADVRVAEARGIADSQRIIAESLTDGYLQYLAIKAQEKMATGTNHTEVYIPSGYNGIPLVKTLDAHEPPPEKKK